ncbi:Hpt domain-containing protein, partial [Methylobacterium sp. ARG-1]|uniref:Hpt domain-containing protein n=1 Tax=Methylobacterium sp. ARG-1 TaxID=1692501 RepID=UPI0006A3FDB7
MTDHDPRAVFLAEANELLDRLETTLLDLGDRPDDSALIDTAFRALHTIKGSGAMFGFDRVAAFTHDFETAFDLVRRGEVPTSADLVNVSLSAKDFIRTLIEDPDATAPVIGEAILAELERLISRAKEAPETELAAEGPSPDPATEGWRIGIAFAPDVLRNGTNPLALLDELRELGPCTVVPRVADLPDLAGLDPESLALGWDVTLRGGATREAIEDVFLFVRDDMVLTLAPLDAPEPAREPALDPSPAPVPVPMPVSAPAPALARSTATPAVEPAPAPAAKPPEAE